MKTFLNTYFLLASCFVCLSGRADIPIIKSIAQAIWGTDEMESPASGILSTNWINEAKAALSTNYPAEELSFRNLTNLMRLESERGNHAAEGLWGFALVIQSHSKEDTSSGLELLRDSAKKGYLPAILNLGLLFENGQYVERDYKEEFHWFSLAADKNDAEGQLRLGVCYAYGLGATTNLPMAAQLYRRSAEQGNYAGMKNLGYVLMDGRGVDKNEDEARYWFTRAAKEGNNARAMYDLGIMANRKSAGTNSTAEAFRWFRQSADLGDPLACMEVADFYYRGWGVVETNRNQYYDWLARAATLGATDAQYLMGLACSTGDGFPKDSELSMKWYQKAAAKNDPRAFYDMALYYLAQTNETSLGMANSYMVLAAQRGHRHAQYQCALNCFRGYGTPRDFEKGKQWLLKSAENNWGPAEFLLFLLYYGGATPCPGCPRYPQDSDEAIKWIRRAAEHQNFQAQSMLAVMLIRGQAVEQNKAEAEKLLRNAAEHGYTQAQNDLGYSIQNGDTEKRDLVEAAMWCQLAKSRATESNLLQRATVNFSTASSQLSAEEKAEVARRVKAFHPVPVEEIYPLSPGWETNSDYQQEDGRFH